MSSSKENSLQPEQHFQTTLDTEDSTKTIATSHEDSTGNRAERSPLVDGNLNEEVIFEAREPSAMSSEDMNDLIHCFNVSASTLFPDEMSVDVISKERELHPPKDESTVLVSEASEQCSNLKDLGNNEVFKAGKLPRSVNAINDDILLKAKEPPLVSYDVNDVSSDDSMEEGPRGKQDEDSTFPYVPMSVEEISLVTSLKYWTNTKVRVVGKFLITDFSKFIFHGVGEDQGNVCLNLENLDQYPKHGDIVEVFGKLYPNQSVSHENLEEKAETTIILKVMFFNPVLDFVLYTKALSMVKPYIPLFVRRKK